MLVHQIIDKYSRTMIFSKKCKKKRISRKRFFDIFISTVITISIYGASGVEIFSVYRTQFSLKIDISIKIGCYQFWHAQIYWNNDWLLAVILQCTQEPQASIGMLYGYVMDMVGVILSNLASFEHFCDILCAKRYKINNIFTTLFRC